MSNKIKVLEEWFQRVWGQEDKSAINEMFVPDGKASGLGSLTLIGPEDFKIFHTAICKLISNIETKIDNSVEQGDWISVLITINAISKKDKKPVSLTGNCTCIIKNGKIIEAYNHLDFMGLYSQLGFLPTDCFEKGLSGCSIV